MKILVAIAVCTAFPILAQAQYSGDDAGPASLKEVVEELNRVGAGAAARLQRHGDSTSIAKGALLFNQHCMQCHVEDAVGAPDWHQRDADGNFPPPPLNGTAHAWHHSQAQLIEMIRNGGPIMPAFSATLSVVEIIEIIHWFQSLWSDRIYSTWLQINTASE